MIDGWDWCAKTLEDKMQGPTTGLSHAFRFLDWSDLDVDDDDDELEKSEE